MSNTCKWTLHVCTVGGSWFFLRECDNSTGSDLNAELTALRRADGYCPYCEKRVQLAIEVNGDIVYKEVDE